MACSLPFALLFFWPMIDRGKERHPKKRPLGVGFGLIGLLAALVLGYLGHVSGLEKSYFGMRYHFSEKGWPTRVADDAPPSDAGGH
jgi:quinol-cytochrome oxidoreductase complex cytochrome b subunit